VGNYGLEIREKIRGGEKVEKVEIFCEPVK